MPLQVGIVGARRRSQGIGEHIARHLAALGANVVAIVGTQPDTLAEARDNLCRRHGIEVRGYLDLEAMLAAERLDAVAICSPDACHRQHLRIALARGVHVLCEKPLVFEPARDSLADARPLVAGFAAARRMLMVNQQWPYTLPAFEELYPGVVDQARPPRQLEMLLCPGSTGAAMVPNALPHVLSLLLALAPVGGEACRIEVRGEGPPEAPNSLDITFAYVHSQGTTAVRCVFRQGPTQPRPAGYAIDGYAVRRVIDATDYSMRLEAVEANARSVPLPDPMSLLLTDFLRRIETATVPQPADPTLLDAQRLLCDVYRAAVAQLSPGHAAPFAAVPRPALARMRLLRTLS